jgi:AraC-like DNA-binding protein/mannose-6-phosphate isomerase-like protein (cupin superfamily)
MQMERYFQYGDGEFSCSYTYTQTSDLQNFSMHTHENHELYYFLSGRGVYRIESSEYPMRPGDILIMSMAESHSLIPKGDAPYERISVHFSPELLTETLNSRLLAPFTERSLGTGNRYAAAELPGAFIRSCLERLFACGAADGESGVLAYLVPLLQELHTVWQKRSPAPEEEAQQLGTRLVAYINRHLTELDSLQQLEQAFFLSPSQINRVFRRYTGTSVWEYVQLKRLLAARQLLYTGVLPNRAAAACGYREYSTFYRAYKKHFGHTPQQDLRTAPEMPL